MSVAEQKRAARATAKQVRDNAAKVHPGASGRLAAFKDELLNGIGEGRARDTIVVSGYLPIGSELDPLALMEAFHQEGASLALPVMEAAAQPLVFRAWRPGDALVARQWGIREPAASAPKRLPDVMLVPLLAFDRQGFRLGYGGGFYDRTISLARAERPVWCVGVAFAEQGVDAVPRDAYDQRLDAILTPAGLSRFATG